MRNTKVSNENNDEEVKAKKANAHETKRCRESRHEKMRRREDGCENTQKGRAAETGTRTWHTQ